MNSGRSMESHNNNSFILSAWKIGLSLQAVEISIPFVENTNEKKR